MNLRVLFASLTIAAIAGIVLVAGFWNATPTSMDYSSGGKLSEQGPTPAAQPSTPTPSVPLPQAVPAAPTPPPTPPTTP